MYLCYPKQSNKTVACIISVLACQQFLPLCALQLQRVIHFIADDNSLSRFNLSSDCVRIDSTIELQNLDTGARGWVQLVTPENACYRRGHISVLSPLGSALLGKTTESTILLRLLGQSLRFRLLTVLYVKHSKIRS